MFTHLVYSQLNAVDAPEHSAVHFVKTDDLITLFECTGCADLCEELPKNGMEGQEDPHGGPIKEFWLRFTTPHTVKEVTFILTLEALVNSKSDGRKRLRSPDAVSQGSPFLLLINALMVVTGLCHVVTRFCPDKLILGFHVT